MKRLDSAVLLVLSFPFVAIGCAVLVVVFVAVSMARDLLDILSE